jgi:hypothetical protein
MLVVVGHAAQTAAEQFLPTCHDPRAPICPRSRGNWAKTCHPHHRCRGDDSRARGADDSKYCRSAESSRVAVAAGSSRVAVGRLAVPPRAVGCGPAVAARSLAIVTAVCARRAAARTRPAHSACAAARRVIPLRAAAREGAGRACCLAECWPPSSERTQPVTMPRRCAATARPQPTARSDTARRPSTAPRVGVGLGLG